MILEKLKTSFSGLSDALIENGDGLAPDRRATFYGRYLANFVSILITGNFFTGLLLAMGADDVYIGYISMITSFCGCVQFLAPMILERMQKRKTLFIWSRCIYHLLNIVALGVIPLLPAAQNLRLGLFMAAVILMNLINSFSASGITIWQLQCLPGTKHNNYFTYVNLGNTIINVATSYCASALLDNFEADSISLFGITPTISAILILRAAALAAAVLEIVCYIRIREFPYQNDGTQKNSSDLKLLLLPLGNRNFMMTISITIIFNFASAIICNFYNIYLIDILDVSYTFMSVCNMIFMPVAILVTPLWSKLIHNRGWQKMLPAAIGLYSFAYFFNALVNSDTILVFYPLIALICQLAYPCISLVFSYLPYINMPESSRTAYNSFYALCGTVAGFLGTATGTAFMGMTQGKTLTIFGFSMLNYQYINLLQFVLMLVIMIYILRVQHKIAAKQ